MPTPYNVYFPFCHLETDEGIFWKPAFFKTIRYDLLAIDQVPHSCIVIAFADAFEPEFVLCNKFEI